MRYLMMAVALSAGSVQAAEVDVLTAEARQQAQALGQSLMKTLKQGIKSSGPVEAIGLCNVQAPAIASQLSQGEWQVGRTALKIRNPGNAPDEWETETLKSFDARIKAHPLSNLTRTPSISITSPSVFFNLSLIS